MDSLQRSAGPPFFDPNSSKPVNAGAQIMHNFNPYTENGGTILCISGEDYVIAAGDTRLSEGYNIHTRDCPKTFQLTSTTVLCCAGFHGDTASLVKLMNFRLANYYHQHGTEMSVVANAQMLSNILYYRRFFPFYVYNILAGIDPEGKGALYSYDPVGNYERFKVRCAGSGSALLQPLLDSKIDLMNQVNPDKTPMSRTEVINLVKDVFTGASERDIYTGDSVIINIITKDGVEKETFPLRKD
eukprot:Nk52_evm38s370 gene=Nk52_evmTU38s370